MKIGRFLGAGLLALGLCNTAALASTASSFASIYDITFEVSSLDPDFAPSLTFGAPSSQATYVQAAASDSAGNLDMTFVAGSTLFAPLFTSLTLNDGSGTSTATASSSATSLIASGITSTPLGSYSADAGLNQEYQGATTFGGWFTLSGNTEVVLSGRYDLLAGLAGTLCGVTGNCSSAFASVLFGLGDQLFSESEQVFGDSGPVSAQRTDQGFSLVLRNELSTAIDVYFTLAASVFGIAADVAEDGGGGNDGGPGGGAVPAPSTLALLTLALAGLALTRRQRARSPLAQGGTAAA